MTKVNTFSFSKLYELIIKNVPEIRTVQLKIKVMKAFVSIYYNSTLTMVYNELSDAAYRSNVLRYSWLSAHLITMTGSIYYFYSVILNNHTDILLGYKASVVGSCITYSLVTLNHLMILIEGHNKPISKKKVGSASSKSQASINLKETRFSNLLNTENTHLLAISFLTLTSPMNGLKLITFLIYSIMNLSTFVISDLFESNPVMSSLMPLLEYLVCPLLKFSNNVSFLLIFVYAKEMMFEQNYSSFLTYTLVYCLKLDSSQHCRDSLHSMLLFFDYFLISIHAPVTVLKIWHQFRIVMFNLIPTSENPYVNATVKQDRVASLIVDYFPVVNDVFDI